jgi:RNA polymerase-binding transcription factor DksA
MDEDKARQALLEERDRLQGVRATFDDDGLDSTETDSVGELSSIDQHQADLGTETFEREKDLSIIERIEAELHDVEYALQRLDDGTYGTCEACGRPIGEARLDAMPAARLCLDDQAQAEREARFAAPDADRAPGPE